jgi:amino acid permease
MPNSGLNRVFDLPPFWLAFAFMALVSLPMSYVALPISAAPLGAMPSVGIIAFVTLTMCLATAAIAEAIVLLPANVRPNNLGDLVTIYLGKRLGFLTGIAISIVFFIVLVACMISMVETLHSYTSISEITWLIILGFAVLWIVSVGSLTHSLSMIAGLLALVVMVAILVALIPFINFDRLLFLQMPFMAEHGIASELWSGFLGMVILSFIGPLLLVPSASYVLPNNPEANLYIKGSLCGIIFQGALMALWVITVEISVIPTELIGLHGTVFIKLGEVTNTFIQVMGIFLVFILPGLASIRSAAQLGVQMRIFLIPSKRRNLPTSSLFLKYTVPVIPSICAFLLVGFLIEKNRADVSAFLSIGGILGSSIATGIVPILLYQAVKRRGIAETSHFMKLFRNNLVLLFSAIFFLAVLLLYGLVVWDSIAIQALSCVIALVSLVLLFKAFTKSR